ncbi:hypothetical protein [Enterobacter hormaechei]|uniref:hypothetical protein n=1 Tax=Enterobacter hormaechei TaxID=158836 RepID=UPI0023AF972F|nr:hypothetical protein [Enterobacter hormaechei]MDE7845106.1 hypothetical protein [Enterobacter hormaechei]
MDININDFNDTLSPEYIIALSEFYDERELEYEIVALQRLETITDPQGIITEKCSVIQLFISFDFYDNVFYESFEGVFTEIPVSDGFSLEVIEDNMVFKDIFGETNRDVVKFALEYIEKQKNN